MTRVKAECLQQILLPCGNRMVKPVDAVHLLDHLDLLQFLDRGGDCHVVRLRHISFHLIPELAVHPVADDQGDELHKDLAGDRLVGMDPGTPVAEVGFVSPKQFLMLVPAFVEVQSLFRIHVRRSGDHEVPAEAELPFDHIAPFFPKEKQILLLVIDKIEVLVECAGEGCVFHLIGSDEFRHAVDLGFDLLLLDTVLHAAVVEVEVPFLGIRCVQSCPDGLAVDLVRPDRTGAIVLEGSLMSGDEITHQSCHALDHDDEIVAAFIHVGDVALAEIPPVKDEPDVPVPIPPGFLQHELQLGYIDDASGILLVEQRFPVGLVIGDGIVEHR